MKASAFRKEAEVMKGLTHKNILKTYGVCSSKPVYIVIEFMPNGSLLHLLKENQKLRQSDMKNMASQVRT